MPPDTDSTRSSHPAFERLPTWIQCSISVMAIAVFITTYGWTARISLIYLGSAEECPLIQQCSEAAYALSALNSPSLRDVCWTHANEITRLSISNGLDAICNVQGSLLEKEDLWFLYCSQLRSMGIIPNRPKLSTATDISTNFFVNKGVHSELQIIAAYLESYMNILNGDFSSSWPTRHWQEVYLNLTSLAFLFAESKTHILSMLDDEIRCVQDLREATISMDQWESTTEVETNTRIHWDDLSWQMEHLKVKASIHISSITLNIQNILGRIKEKLSPMDDLAYSPNNTISMINLLPRPYEEDAPFQTKARTLRSPQANLAHPTANAVFKINSNFSTPGIGSTEQGFYKRVNGTATTWFAPGSDMISPRHQTTECIMRAYLGRAKIVSKRPGQQFWVGLVKPEHFDRAADALLDLQQTMITLCKTPTFVVKRTRPTSDIDGVGHVPPPGCQTQPFEHMLSYPREIYPLSKQQEFILATIDLALGDNDCSYLPWTPTHFHQIHFYRAIFCKKSFVEEHWPLKNETDHGVLPVTWYNRTIFIIRPNMDNFNKFPTPVFTELCPTNWPSQKEQCNMRLFAQEKALRLLDKAQPFKYTLEKSKQQFLEQMDLGPFAASWPLILPLDKYRQEDTTHLHRRRKRGWSILQLLGLNTFQLEARLNKVSTYARMTHKGMADLHNATVAVMRRLRDQRRSRNEYQLGQTMALLLDTIHQAMKAQVAWIQQDITIFKENMDEKTFRTKRLLQIAELEIDWNHMWTAQLNEFNSSCTRTTLGLYCTVAMVDDVWNSYHPVEHTKEYKADIFRYDVVNPLCTLAEPLPRKITSSLGLAGIGTGLSLMQIHRLFSDTHYLQEPMLVAEVDKWAMIVDSVQWHEQTFLRIDKDRSWQTPYPAMLFHSRWENLFVNKNPTSLTYASSAYGFNLYTRKELTIPIYTCMTDQPILLTLEPGSHAMNFIKANERTCLDGNSNLNRLYIAPRAHADLIAFEEKKQDTLKRDPIWALGNPAEWNSTITKLLVSIAAAHMGRLRDSHGELILPEYNVTWEDIPTGGPIYSTNSGDSSSVSQFFEDVGTSIVRTLDFTKTTRDRINTMVDMQEARFNNMTDEFLDQATVIAEANTLKYLSLLSSPLTYATGLLGTILSAIFAWYKCKRGREQSHLLADIASKVNKDKDSTSEGIRTPTWISCEYPTPPTQPPSCRSSFSSNTLTLVNEPTGMSRDTLELASPEPTSVTMSTLPCGQKAQDTQLPNQGTILAPEAPDDPMYTADPTSAVASSTE